MSKVITSPVKKWPGTVTLHDPLTLPMCAAFERSNANAHALQDQAPTRSEIQVALLSGVLACVERFDLTGLPEQIGVENFPGSPRVESARLINWLVSEVSHLYLEGNADPLE